jgi:hypothetical protein
VGKGCLGAAQGEPNGMREPGFGYVEIECRGGKAVAEQVQAVAALFFELCLLIVCTSYSSQCRLPLTAGIAMTSEKAAEDRYSQYVKDVTADIASCVQSSACQPILFIGSGLSKPQARMSCFHTASRAD